MRLAQSEQAILRLLVAGGPQYGLELVHASEGRLKRGGIYVTLGRMEEKGLVTSESGDAGRRVYRPTALGERAHLAAQLFAGEIRLGGGHEKNSQSAVRTRPVGCTEPARARRDARRLGLRG